MRSILGVCLFCGLTLGMPAGATVAADLGRFADVGSPFIRNYSPKEYGVESQNWAIVQDARGVVYAGNNQGVLEYDGVRWRLIQTPNKTMVRSLAVDGTGRVYVGAVGEIGYLAPDATGQASFVSMNDLLAPADRAFTDVWVTVPTSHGMLFQTREALFLFAEGRFRTWKASTTFHVAFSVRDRIFVREREVGLLELDHDRLSLVPGGDRFARESVFAMLPLDDPAPDGSILIGSRKQGLFRFHGDGIVPFPSDATGFLKDNALYHGIRLADGTLAMATIQGGVVFLDPQGHFLRVIDRSSGLQGDNVKFLFDDGCGSLWMALDNGISRVELPSPLSIFDERSGLKGTVWALQRHKGTLYVATGQGVLALEPARGFDAGGKASTRRALFRPVEGITTQSLDLLSLDEGLLVANAQGVFEIQGGKTRPIRPSSNISISLHRSLADPGRVFIGLQGGLASIHRDPRSPGGWKDEGLVPGISDDVYSIEETKDGYLWLGTAARGVIRIELPKGWEGGSSIPSIRTERFDASRGFPALVQPYVHEIGGCLMASTHLGLYRFEEASGRFLKDSRFDRLFPEGPRWVKGVREDSRGRVWMHSINETSGLHETGAAIPQPDGSCQWNPIPFRRFSESSMETIYLEKNGVVWFGGPDGIIRYDDRILRQVDRPFGALVRRVTKGGGRLLFGGEGETARRDGPDLKYAENILRFEFAAPSFDQESATLYQVCLEGYDKDWSPWTHEAVKEYTNLPEGRYRFKVRALNVYGYLSLEGGYAFRILPPWYRTWWAYLSYLGLGSCAIFLGFHIRTRILRQRNLELQIRIAEATWELSEREHRLQQQAQDLERMNGELRILNEQKNHFLGIVAHDLRNPLNGIVLAAELIQSEEEHAEVVRRAEQISREGMDMSQLISRFLDVAAIDSGKIKAEPEPFSLKRLAMQIAERHSYRASEKGLDLQVFLPEGEGTVLADPKFMKEVLDNLVSNAVKFSPPGRAVRIRLDERDGKQVLSVEDDGPGLTDEDKRKLFGRFSRLSAPPTGGEKSVGLGLSIVKHMVDAMGARIWVESEPGRGAAFRVELPE